MATSDSQSCITSLSAVQDEDKYGDTATSGYKVITERSVCGKRKYILCEGNNIESNSSPPYQYRCSK